MIESTSYQDSERYQNNISPEPSNLSLTNQCYKTPIYQNVNTLIHNSQLPLHSLYPTPPSDNEDSNHLTTRLELDNTPKLTENYYFNNLAGNNSYQSKHAQNDVNNKSDEVSNESSQSATPTNQLQMNNNNNNTNSNRYKRRSRTTYSKIQLDTLESTFQKTHYPEIRVVDELSSMLNLSTERISIWFQNRRARFKKARKLENNQELISQPAQYKPSQADSVYSAASYGLAASNYPSSNLDTNYLLNSIDKNPLKLLNHQLIAEKLNLNKYSPSVQETNNYGMLQPNNTFYQTHYPNIIPNEQNFYNHNNYQQLIRNDTSPIANYSMTSANNLTYHQTSSIVQ